MAKVRTAKTAKSTPPNAGLEKQYREKLQELISEMSTSVNYWISAEYRKQESEIVGDASPGKALSNKLISVMATWREKFDKKAESIALWFVRRSDAYTSRSVSNKLRAEGMTVSMQITPEVQTVLDSLYETQVGLIKSIPEQYLTQVQTLVQQSVTNGRDVGFLKEELKKRYGITERRAKVIARDQNAKASNAISRERCKSAGVTHGIWVHRAGGSKTYRQSHLKMNGEKFELAAGCYDPHEGREVHPGELINCKCDFRPVIPKPGE
ncbi:phage head morphogenesis protein [Serratia fonticola]|uniref:phage head morphogenesis protein n=1 Tax=Serratia fonticola TaxID=47917 RepID=UPI0021BB9B99|nr:phage minor head protein [Serratia fonticola]